MYAVKRSKIPLGKEILSDPCQGMLFMSVRFSECYSSQQARVLFVAWPRGISPVNIPNILLRHDEKRFCGVGFQKYLLICMAPDLHRP